MSRDLHSRSHFLVSPKCDPRPHTTPPGVFDIENEFMIKIPDQEFKVTTIQEIVDAVDRFISEQRIGVSSDKQS